MYFMNVSFLILHTITGLAVHSLQIQIYCCKDNHTIYITNVQSGVIFPLFHQIFIILKMFQIKAVNISDIYVLCNVPIFCTLIIFKKNY